MTPSQTFNRAGLYRAVSFCLLTLALLVGLNFVFVTPTHAQSNLIIVQNNVAKVRYREGIQFNVTATIQDSQVNHADLKLKFGKNGKEETDSVDVVNGVATFFISEDAGSLATGMPVIYSWVLSDGRVQLQTNNQTVVYQDQTHNWLQVEGPHVTLRWYNGDDSYGQLMYQLASDALSTYKRRFNMDPQDQIYITIYGSTAAYHSTFPDVPEWSGGFSKYGGVEIVAIAPQDMNSGIFIGEGIPHELSHAALYQFLNGPAPRWLDEGFAVYNQNVISIKEYDDLLQEAYAANSLIPLNTLDKKWPAAEDSAMLAYAEGRSIVTFLINTYGNDVWANVLDQLRRHDADGAFTAVLGVNLSTVEGLWKTRVLGGQKVSMPAALKTGPVPSQPTVDDYAARTGTAPAVAPGKTATVPQTENTIFWPMMGIAFVAILTLITLSVIIIRNRRRIARMYRFRRQSAPAYEDVDLHARLSTFQNQPPLPSDPAPIARMTLPPALSPFAQPNGQPNTWQPSYNQSQIPPAPPFAQLTQQANQSGTSFWPGTAPIPGQVSTPSQPGNTDPFDFINTQFNNKSSGSTTYSAGSFLELDPYGLSFDPLKTEVKEKQV